MRLSEIEKKARKIGVKDTWRHSKKELIKAIQRAEGNFDCFGSASAKTGCNQISCCWRVDCLR